MEESLNEEKKIYVKYIDLQDDNDGSEKIMYFDTVDAAKKYIDDNDEKSIIVKASNIPMEIEEKLIDPPSEDIAEFEAILDKNGFEIEAKGKTWLGSDHYQIRKTVDDEIQSTEELRDHIMPLLDDIKVFEEAKNIPVTWNFGYDGSLITAGLDLREKWVEDIDEAKRGFMSIAEKLNEIDKY